MIVEVDTVVVSAVVEGDSVSVVAVTVVGVVVVVAVVLLTPWHCSRLGCLGPDTTLHCLAPLSRMLQTWSPRL